MEATEGLADATSDASQSVQALAQLANSERVSHKKVSSIFMHKSKGEDVDAQLCIDLVWLRHGVSWCTFLRCHY